MAFEKCFICGGLTEDSGKIIVRIIEIEGGLLGTFFPGNQVECTKNKSDLRSLLNSFSLNLLENPIDELEIAHILLQEPDRHNSKYYSPGEKKFGNQSKLMSSTQQSANELLDHL